MRRQKERRVQQLLRDHPYLLHADLAHCRGTVERRVAGGRLDIDYQTEQGWIVVECKIRPLVDADVLQLCRYLKDLHCSKRRVLRAYLVGGRPKAPLSRDLLAHPPGITVVRLLQDIPTFLALSEGRHYFDADLDVCPYDGTRPLPGKYLEIDV